jgi:hypothetical protein
MYLQNEGFQHSRIVKKLNLIKETKVEICYSRYLIMLKLKILLIG